MATAREKWEAVILNTRIVEFFAGLFQQLGIEVVDTGETFTAVHHGDRISFTGGIDRGQVDYVVRIQSLQVDRLAEHARTGRLDAMEQYRVIATLFTPATAAMLQHPVLASNLLRRLAGAEDLIHAGLVPPECSDPSEPDTAHTLVYANRQWIVIPGRHGRPRRSYRLTVEEAIDYQRHALTVLRAKTVPDWVRFARWYRAWRRHVSGRPA